MADAKLSELTAATTPAAAADLLYIVQGVNSRKISLENLNSSAANVNMKSKVQLGSSTATITAAGESVGLTSTVTNISSADGPGRIFIPRGVENQIKIITMSLYGGDFWISSNIANSANLVFSNVGHTATLIYNSLTSNWHVISLYNS